MFEIIVHFITRSVFQLYPWDVECLHLQLHKARLTVLMDHVICGFNPNANLARFM